MKTPLPDSGRRMPLLLALLLALPLAAAESTVEVVSEDGFALAATVWQHDGQAPGILLLHQCDRDRTMYAELAAELADAGLRVLTFDFRGLGESRNEAFDLGAGATPDDWERATAKFPADVEAAHRFLEQQGGEDGRVVGALGASCGGRELIALAEAHPELEMLAFLSARLSGLEVRSTLQLRSRSLLLIASKGDARANQAAGTIAWRTGRNASDLLLFEGDAHGYVLLLEHPDLVDRIVDWFRAGAASPLAEGR